MDNYRLDGNSGTRQFLEPSSCLSARFIEKITGSERFDTSNLVTPLVSAIPDGSFRIMAVGGCTRLADHRFGGVSAARIVPENQSRRDYHFGRGSRKRHLGAELVFLMGLSLGDAPGLRLVDAINPAMVSTFLLDGFSDGLSQIPVGNLKPETTLKIIRQLPRHVSRDVPEPSYHGGVTGLGRHGIPAESDHHLQ
ncbi:MAG: hypothetical protein LBG06_08440 [Deltaproteobacteria bacterium]|jgi:hypothetical protein|nr:hypothetical protein [Deltaproteobacteria bacterium]